ncbi:2-succinyl-5-enolpyruvyl-6-hydroxy-3-cyclohexene-1-carboxylic-acid synthase [Pseudonocardia acaciae]|uniref:2-succinyl-5-enolpyruvyl-6-hydroxy-3- cyclohexene-1-carboxylic-acid synthase n=1 Tax=Pseudonocardia acaciae TaxID=551276 RepID=UPI000684D7FA|nr:2-succinyl-5-enolpyruvyl-6-hydroxy-3-cyclohexene-1-carboxylic-acid synthase [Pseudonocardia acaciae]
MNPSTAQAEVIVDELIRRGVADAVLCPGSRNAPLSFALHRAELAGRIRLHVRIDERTGAFLALGLALRSGRPVPVACTSGTAAANLHPAVLEASYAGVPLLALTADRPPELVGTGANQTIVQHQLFGRAPRLSVTLPVARAGTDGELTAWRASVARAVGVALGAAGGGRVGPVHLNLPFAEPLVPDVPGGYDVSEPVDGAPWPAPALPPAVADAATLPLDPSAPTLVLAGGVPAGPVPGLPADLGVPVVAEPHSPLWPRALRTGPWLLGSPALERLRPAQVLLHGRPTLHRPVARLLADRRVAVYAVAGTVGTTGPEGAELPPSVRAVGVPPPLRPPPDWCSRWERADAAASAALDRALADPATPVGLRLAAAVVAGLPDGALLVLGSSNPVRDASLAARPCTGLTVLSNRGVAGIDGTVSTATGAALAHGGPAYALIGDLTVLHDLTGLVVGPYERAPELTLVVLNDAGGGVFSLLEQGAPEYAGSFERVFGTPHAVRLDAVCAGLGIGHRRVDDLGGLADALAGGSEGVRVLEVPASRAGLRAGHAAVRAAVDAAVSDAGVSETAARGGGSHDSS